MHGQTLYCWLSAETVLAASATTVCVGEVLETRQQGGQADAAQGGTAAGSQQRRPAPSPAHGVWGPRGYHTQWLRGWQCPLCFYPPCSQFKSPRAAQPAVKVITQHHPFSVFGNATTLAVHLPMSEHRAQSCDWSPHTTFGLWVVPRQSTAPASGSAW